MQSHDHSDLQRLYAKTGRAAILKTARLVGRFDVAEEIVQAAFLKLWGSGLTFEHERAAYAWIYRACHNAGIDHLRAHATRFESGVTSEVLETHANARQSGTIFADAVEDRDTLRAHLAELTEREAEVLAYRVVDGMTQQEIAEVMGLSRKTIVRISAEIEGKLARTAAGTIYAVGG